jgi:hypothetical protein
MDRRLERAVGGLVHRDAMSPEIDFRIAELGLD